MHASLGPGVSITTADRKFVQSLCHRRGRQVTYLAKEVHGLDAPFKFSTGVAFTWNDLSLRHRTCPFCVTGESHTGGRRKISH